MAAGSFSRKAAPQSTNQHKVSSKGPLFGGFFLFCLKDAVLQHLHPFGSAALKAVFRSCKIVGKVRINQKNFTVIGNIMY